MKTGQDRDVRLPKCPARLFLSEKLKFRTLRGMIRERISRENYKKSGSFSALSESYEGEEARSELLCLAWK